MSDDAMSPAERQAKFLQVSRNLASLAETLCHEHREFPRGDFGRAFMVAALALLTGAVGDLAAIDYLRRLADDLEARCAGERSPTMN